MEQHGDTAHDADTRRLTIELALPRPVDPTMPRRLHIVVEDVGEADAAAPVLFETDVDAIVQPDGSIAAFEVELPAIPDAAQPAVRVHVDEGSTGALETGDFVNPALVRLPQGPRPVVDMSMTELR